MTAAAAAPETPPPPPVKDGKEPVRAPRPCRRKKFLVLLFIIVLGGLTYGAVEAPGPLQTPASVVIPRGTGVRGIGAILDKNNAIYSPFLFRAAALVIAVNVLKAGEYPIDPGESMAQIIDAMHEGRSVLRSFTVSEGLTSAEILSLLKNMEAMGGDIAMPAEGSLLPETYKYSYGDTRAAMILRMQRAMQETLVDLWDKRDPSLPLKNPHEAVVMASIIEKETGKASERPRIAGVFYNRLRKSMRLQSDPTVIYGIVQARGILDHDLGHDDLAFPSPYNTYANDGLPPHPICNPGRAAIEAALHPETNDYLYFVADGTGGHTFSRSLDEHNHNVAKLMAPAKPPAAAPPPPKPKPKT